MFRCKDFIEELTKINQQCLADISKIQLMKASVTVNYPELVVAINKHDSNYLARKHKI